METSSDPVGNGACNRPACSTVSQRTASPRATFVISMPPQYDVAASLEHCGTTVMSRCLFPSARSFLSVLDRRIEATNLCTPAQASYLNKKKKLYKKGKLCTWDDGNFLLKFSLVSRSEWKWLALLMTLIYCEKWQIKLTIHRSTISPVLFFAEVEIGLSHRGIQVEGVPKERAGKYIWTF